MDNQNQNNQQPIYPTPSQVPPQPAKLTTPPKPPTKSGELKRMFLQVLIACLVAAASIAVVTVLFGSFNDVLGRALATIVAVAVHAMLSLGYIAGNDSRDAKDGGRSIELFTNTVFTLIVASFATSLFAIWQILEGDLVGRLYLFYGVLLFATLHADILYRIRRFEGKIDSLVTANYWVITVVVAMLTIIIFSGNSYSLGEFYYRVLAASGIIDATMTITAIIMHKLFLQKHPELAPSAKLEGSARSKDFWHNPIVVLLFIYLAFQVISGILMLAAGGLSNR